MKVQLLARPDHSVFLHEGLRELGVDVRYETFYAFRRGGVLARLWPSRRSVAPDARSSLLFTALSYPVISFGRRLPWNWRWIEQQLGELLLRPRDLGSADLVHYWPFYFETAVRRLKERAPGVTTLAEFYELEPSWVNAGYRQGYEQLGLTMSRPINELVDQGAAFGFESNFLVASELVRRSYLRRYPAANIHVVTYGLLGNRLESLPALRKERRRWVFVGRVSLEKGVHVLLEAMRGRTDLELDLIGPTDPRQERVLAEQLRGVANVRRLGSMRQSEVVRLLPRYDAFVLPSLADAYSLAVIEAWCAGLPVVVTDNCGNAGTVDQYGLGAVARTHDASSLREAMSRVAFDTDTDALTAGLQRFEADEERSSYPARVLQLYRTLIAQRATPTSSPATRS